MPPQRAAMAQQPSPHPPPRPPPPPLSLSSSGGRAPKSRRPQVPHFNTGEETGLEIDEMSKSAISFFLSQPGIDIFAGSPLERQLKETETWYAIFFTINIPREGKPSLFCNKDPPRAGPLRQPPHLPREGRVRLLPPPARRHQPRPPVAHKDTAEGLEASIRE